MIIEKLIDVQLFNLPKPDYENMKNIIEYQQIFDLKTEFLVAKHISTLSKQANDFINEILELNTHLGENEDIVWPKPLCNTIQNVRRQLGDKSKDQLVLLEDAIEKTLSLTAKQSLTLKLQAKPDRPRKNKIPTNIKNNKSSEFMANFL